MAIRSVFVLAAALVWTSTAGAIAGAAAADPVAAASGAVSSDPSPALLPPASFTEVAIPSHGARLNGIVYGAAGPQPHPVVVILHGYPGNERNLDLAQALRREGYDVLFFDYRGNWGSGGTFSFAGGLEDVASVLAWVRDPKIAAERGFDAERIALVGHSFGGWLALLSAADQPKVTCIAALAAWNIGWAVPYAKEHPSARGDLIPDFRSDTDPNGGPIRARAEDLETEIERHATEWNYLNRAATLGDRDLLLVGVSRDTPDEDIAMQERLGAAVRAAGGKHVVNVSYEDDHSLSSHRIAVAELVAHWLHRECPGLAPRSAAAK